MQGLYINSISDTVIPEEYEDENECENECECEYDYDGPKTPDPEKLQYCGVTLYPNSVCANLSQYEDPPPPSQFCAGFIEGGGADSCQGDR